MAVQRQSYDIDIDIPPGAETATVMRCVEQAAEETGLYISHIGGYSRVKYPNSVHWHFKRHKGEVGLIDATYWREGGRFWLIARHSEPAWVHETAPRLQRALHQAFRSL